ncbi:MAG: OmpA family protein [Alphaproteobacteria bacterium]|nr:OmpA family protein [Alphaproteobacteria bacterium]
MKFPKRINAILLTIAFFGAASSTVWAADKGGCRDFSGMERFEGADIENCLTRNFEVYGLLTGGMNVQWDQKEGLYTGPDAETVEGRRNWIHYRTADGDSSEQVYRYYMKQIPAAGFRILNEGKAADNDSSDLNLDAIMKTLKGSATFSEKFRYMTAVKEESSGVRTYLAILVYDNDNRAHIFMDVINVGEQKRKPSGRSEEKNRTSVVVYEENNYGGRNQSFGVGSFDVQNLDIIGNDAIRSVKVPGGLQVELYENGHFEGRKKVLTQDTPALSDFDRVTSSIIIKPKEAAGEGGVVVYEEENYGGRSQVFGTGWFDVQKLNIIGNDAIRSVKVPAGFEVELYEHWHFGGRKKVLNQDTATLPDFSQMTSSIIVKKIADRERAESAETVSAGQIAEGLAAAGRIALYGIHFDFDRDEIRPESGSSISEIAKLMQGNPELKLLVVGHTDSQGLEPHNLDLSVRRASAVIHALVAAGISADHLMAHGAGSSQPVATNDNEEGRAKNRRVELVKQ